MTWWFAKNGLMLALVFWPMLAFHWQISPFFQWPRTPLIAAICLFAAFNIGHYLHLKRHNQRFDRPDTLVTRGWLFARVRHPMYLFDLLVGSMFYLLRPDPVSSVLWILLVTIVIGLARHEDRRMAQRFGAEHDAWRQRSGLLLPRFSRR